MATTTDGRGNTSLKLYELPAEMAAIDRLIDEQDGELTQDILDRLDQIEVTLAVKAEGIACIVRSSQAEAEALQAEIDRLQSRKRAADGRAAGLKEYLLRTMREHGRDKIDAGLFKIRRQRNGVPAVNVDPNIIDRLPDRYKKIVIEPNRAAMRDAARDGEALPDGVEIVYGEHIRIS